MRRLAFLLVACCCLLAGCDSSGPEVEPESEFEAEFGTPVNTKLKGSAAVGDGSSFERGGLFTFTDPLSDQTITAIQLFGTDDEGTPHDLSFMYVADERLGTGTYELNRPFEGKRERGPVRRSLPARQSLYGELRAPDGRFAVHVHV